MIVVRRLQTVGLVAACLTAIIAPGADAHYKAANPGCKTRKCDWRVWRHWGREHPRAHIATGFVVEGATSDFGIGTGDSEGTTADGGSTNRPCIAIRDDSTLGSTFRVTVLGHTALMVHCDWGPAAFTGRNIDITGRGVEALGLNPTNYPTGAYGVAQLVR